MTRSARGPRPPGAILVKLARLLFNEQLISAVLQPTIADLQREVAAAGASHLERRRAQWRGYWAFWRLALVVPFMSWSSPIGHFPDAVARLTAASIVLGLLALADLVLGAGVAVLLTSGTLVALLIHAWYDRHPSDLPTPVAAQRRPLQINFSSTEVAGNIGGLIFVVGSVFIVTLGLPSVIWFLFAGTIAGCFLAWALAAWHTSHPQFGRPENRIVLR